MVKLFARVAAVVTVLAMTAVPALAFEPVASPEAYPERVLGDPDAPITIVEYSSLTCPHCASFHADTLPQIKKEFIDTGKAKLIYRDFPIDRLALGAALVARCAPEDSYFPLLDMMFKSQQVWTRASNPIDALAGYAKLAGMSGDAVEACFENQALLDAIQEVRQRANETYGITSTPSFVIEGEVVKGAYPYEHFAAILRKHEEAR